MICPVCSAAGTRGKGSYQIIDGQGLQVYRRVQAPRGGKRDRAAAYDPTTRISTGIPGLDALTNGGDYRCMASCCKSSAIPCSGNTTARVNTSRLRPPCAAGTRNWKRASVLGKLKLGLGKRRAKSLPACAKVIKETDELLSDAVKYTHTLVAELSPPILRDHGLAAGLQWLAEYMKKYNVAVTVTVPEEELKLPEDQAILLFQSVRELLINSSKHAGTGQAAVTLEQRDDRLLIEVSDQGKGFDLAAVATPHESSSKFGLFSIRERMRSLGGSFDLESAQGQGTTVTLTLPLVSSAECSVLSPELSGRNSALPGRSALSTQDSALQQHAEIRVLLVDDHAMLRQGLRTMLEGYQDVEIVGEACDGLEAVQAVDQLRPGVVVMDINMPKMNGIDATAQIKARHPETIVIGLSVYADGKNQEAMIKAGANLLLSKEAAIDQLHETIHAAAHDHSTSIARSA